MFWVPIAILIGLAGAWLLRRALAIQRESERFEDARRRAEAARESGDQATLEVQSQRAKDASLALERLKLF